MYKVRMQSSDLTSASNLAGGKKVSTEFRSKSDAFYTQILGDSP